MTNYLHRLDLIVPVARIAGLAAWWASEVAASRLEYDDPTQWVGLSANGQLPVTHRRSCGSYTEQQIKRIAIRLTIAAGILLPSDWDTKTREEKRQWVLGNRNAIRSSIGVWIGPCHNDGDWSEVDNSLTAMGLQNVNGN